MKRASCKRRTGRPAVSDYRAISVLKVLLSCLAFITACQSGKTYDNPESAFFDLETFMEARIAELQAGKPQLKKSIAINGKDDETLTRDVNWHNELELFVQANLNKPSLWDSYIVSYPDSSSILYTVKENENLPVKYLKIVFSGPGGKVRTIEAELATLNKLYQSQKKLSMRCNPEGQTEKISSYSIEGYQKLIISAPKNFIIKAAIL